MRPVALLLALAASAQAFVPALRAPASSSFLQTVSRTTSQLPQARSFVPPTLQTVKKGKDGNEVQSKKDASPLAWLPAVARNVFFTLLALSPLGAYESADAAQRSGGRVGGSGFRSAPSQTRRYSAPPSRSYSPGVQSRGYVQPVPVLPYGGYGYGFSPFSPFSPFGFGGGMMGYRAGISPVDVLILGGIAYTAFNIIKNQVGGSQWEGMDETAPSSLGNGVTVLKIQVGLQVSDRSAKDSILGQLDDIARTADVSTRQGLSSLVSSTALALLRSFNTWVSAAGEDQQFSGKGGETEYSRLAIRERSKFEKEVNMMASRSAASSPYLVDSRPTLCVVTLCVAIRGKSTKIGNSLNSAAKLRQALQTLAADAMTDDGENVLATEVLWTPQDEGDVLTKRDLIQDYPELIDI